VVELTVDHHPAPPALSVVEEPDRYAVAGVHDLLGVEAQLVERLVEPLPEAPDRTRTRAGVGPLVLRKDPLDVGVEVLDGGVEVTTVVSRDEVRCLVDVLLRDPPQYPACP
jgi:hypothetical protein